MTGKRGMKGLDIESLPYRIRVYSNNQVLIPAKLIRRLGIQDVKEAYVVFKFRENSIKIHVRLLRTKYTDSRQFTIPKDIREKYNILPGDEVEIIEITPVK